jgi:hypothetical protein
MNQYKFDSRRTQCPFCGSSDGFALLVHPATNKVVADGIGKCHSCNVFKTNDAVGYVSDAGELVAAQGIVEAKYYDVVALEKHGLVMGSGNLVDYAQELFGDAARDVAKQMLVSGDKFGNTSFIYADADNRGMSIKTISYDTKGKRSKDGLVYGSRNLDTAQIAGYVTSEGAIRTVRVSDGAYQFLYGQHRIHNAAPTVIVVESEKTAYIGSLYAPHIIWLATGGSKGLSLNKIRGLRSAKAIPDSLTEAIRKKNVVVCFDYDESGETGSDAALQAMLELGAASAYAMNMRELLEITKSKFPISRRKNADLADVIFWAYTEGDIGNDIDPVINYLIGCSTGKPVLEAKLANKSLQKLAKTDYTAPAPDPSLTFSEYTGGKVSQLAIPGNIVMILASPGIGKSSIVTAMVAKHISPTANAFGLDVKAPRGIVVIDTEQSKDQVVGLHRRLSRRINCNPEDLPDIMETTNVNWYITDKKQKVEQQVENLFTAVQVDNPSFVIIDQIGSLVANVNSIEETTNLIRRIAVDAENSLRTWVVVLHTNPTSDKGRGVLGSDIHRWASSVLFIKRPANTGEPSLLTTFNSDGVMAKVRAGAPVRCFFAWDDERGDFYPTEKNIEESVDIMYVHSAIDEIFNKEGTVSQALEMSEFRKKLSDIYGSSQGNKVFNYIISRGLMKRVARGKLWPDYEKINSANPT